MRTLLFILAASSLASAQPAAPSIETKTLASQGAAQLAAGDSGAAVKSFEKAVALDPTNSVLHHQLGDAYGLAAQKAGMLARPGLAKKSRLAYEKSVELDPANIAARQSLLNFYQMAPGMMGGGMDKAYAQAAEIKRHDELRGRVAFAILHVSEKKYAEATAELDAALLVAPGDYAALFQTGRIAALTGENPDRGIEALQSCLALTPPRGAPGHDAAHWRLGNIWEKKGDKIAARAAYQASLKVNPNFPQAIEALEKLD